VLSELTGIPAERDRHCSAAATKRTVGVPIGVAQPGRSPTATAVVTRMALAVVRMPIFIVDRQPCVSPPSSRPGGLRKDWGAATIAGAGTGRCRPATLARTIIPH
jgi:hypothetical protein